MAFGLGQVDADPGIPDEVLQSLRVPQVWTPNPPDARLRVSAAVRGEVDFATDRGDQALPAWRVDVVDALGPIWVLTERLQSRCWGPPAPVSAERLGPHMLSSATTGPDGRDLVVTFVGGREQLFRYNVEVVQTPTAVSVVPLRRPTDALPAGAFVTLEGHARTVAVRLEEPLGGRVLVNLDGAPVPVTPASL
ncbi:MAG: hypothetical protein ACP5P1_12590 [Acidimicrobiales bacterium]